MKEIIGAQGEITIIKIDALPINLKTKPVERNAHGYIISHSESGHHHVLTGGDVMERDDDAVADGMRIIYACLSAPAELEQDAATPHEKFELPEGIYEFRIAREYDPFAEQARMVAD
ncbi:hypothetical protein [Pseudoxanthomonas sp.]|uniref:hypothetical protein n=1 Tax=Pseudoxanthomonas sp. TaxID=1871049 RepID=UPI002602578C|nr:hypothetical protein [Pseudoxanthomonas sp.]WDS36199.1 MAG: hypothetical protein O8I58_18340 [Pseudoxanthomonas sp.]